MADAAAGTGGIDVVVAVLTYRRTDRLSTLLPLLLEESRRTADRLGAAVRLLVVDNDPAASAAGVVGELGPPVGYVHEPRPGIAAGRARAVAEASEADVLVFIDDDEEPVSGWLVELVEAWLRLGRPAGVVGRVTPVCRTRLDPWIEAGGFFRRTRYATGTQVRAASSANLLLDLAVLRRTGLSFDPLLGLRGGEDTLLTRSLVRQGHRLVWCDEAEVLDVIPPERMTRSWVLRRAFHHGVVASRVTLSLPDAPSRARLVGQGLGRVLVGMVRSGVGVLTGQLERRARGRRLAWRGAGMVTGALGGDVVEYARAGP